MANAFQSNPFKGQVQLIVTGENLVALLNEAAKKGIHLTRIERLDELSARITVPLHQFYSLTSLIKQHRLKMKITQKTGFPFFMYRIQKRKWFAIGFVVFFLMLYLLSSFVWKIEVEGTEKIPKDHVLSLLKKEGVYIGQWKRNLPEREMLQHQLMQKMPQTSWVGMRIEGTRVIVTVVEKKEIEKLEENEGDGPFHLVARKNALIRDLRVERGNPLVKVNDVVQKGQLLVSGIYGDPSQPNSGKIAGAKGKVLGEVWYESDVVVPLTRERKVYTGWREKKKWPFFFQTVVKNPFAKEDPHRKTEIIQHTYAYYLGSIRLPFGWVEEERLEMKWVKEKLVMDQAVEVGMMRAKEELIQQLGQDGRILKQKVLHQSVENGKVYLKVYFDVIENIAKNQPILQGE